MDMQPTPTDDEIRTHSAFPLVLDAYRFNNRVFWGGLPLFAAASIYAIAGHHPWAFIIAGLLAVGNTAGQLYGFRRAREAASHISSSRTAQKRAEQLASSAAKPRLVPGGCLAPERLGARAVRPWLVLLTVCRAAGGCNRRRRERQR